MSGRGGAPDDGVHPVLTQCPFLSFSELQVAPTPPRRRRRGRQSRDGVITRRYWLIPGAQLLPSQQEFNNDLDLLNTKLEELVT